MKQAGSLKKLETEQRKIKIWIILEILQNFPALLATQIKRLRAAHWKTTSTAITTQH